MGSAASFTPATSTKRDWSSRTSGRNVVQQSCHLPWLPGSSQIKAKSKGIVQP